MSAVSGGISSQQKPVVEAALKVIEPALAYMTAEHVSGMTDWLQLPDHSSDGGLLVLLVFPSCHTFAPAAPSCC